eukprot:snap_masked-scaffold_2-processed-gene-16.22-mRNA-1 protein AED:1.00 eAED:1.00 QI:0/0/0/0/1/1/3/0/394
MNRVYIGRQDSFFGESDTLFYENNPFDEVYSYLDISLVIEQENVLSSDSLPYLNEAALEIYDNININSRRIGDTFIYSLAILESLAMIQFIEISIASIYASFSASAVLRKKAQNQKERVILYIRVFQFTVGLNMLWYTLAKFITGGKIYSSAFFYLYALTAALVTGLLFYVILLFRRAVMLDRLYRSELTSSTLSPKSPKRKKLEDLIRPVENAGIVLICCITGIIVANIYFGVNYTSKMDRLRARNENVSKTFEVFNEFCLIAGMVCTHLYLVWTDREAKELLFEDNPSQEIQTKKVKRTSYFFKTGTKQNSSHNILTQRNGLSVVSMPQMVGQHYYNGFDKSTLYEVSSIHQTRINTPGSHFYISPSRNFAPPASNSGSISEVQIPSLEESY